jgi:hypothetical protein
MVLAARIEKEELAESLVRLLRVARVGGDGTRAEIEPVLQQLESLVGPTLNRSQVARLLGVSHTTIARRIEAGDISTVPTASGRAEVPTGEAVALRARLDRLENPDRGRALGDVIRGLRVGAEALDVSGLSRATISAGRGSGDLLSLAYHRVVAARLDDGLVFDARRRLRRWVREGRIHPRWAAEWESLLASPHPDLARTIGLDTEHARSLRQSSPFAGALTAHERRRLVRTLGSGSE